MSTNYKILSIKNRISILSERGKENGRIIKKLQRRLKNLEAAAACTEVQ